MLLFLLAASATALDYVSYVPTGACDDYYNAACDYSDATKAAMCAVVDNSTVECFQMMSEQTMYAGILPDASLFELSVLLFANCGFAVNSLVNGDNQIEPSLRALYQCDAENIGAYLNTDPLIWERYTGAYDAQGLCMNNTACVDAWDTVRSKSKDGEGGAPDFILNPYTGWYDPDPTTITEDQFCNVVFAALEVGDAILMGWLSIFLPLFHYLPPSMNPNDLDPDDILNFCYNRMVDDITKAVGIVMAVSISATFVVASMLVGGGCFWWHTGCSCSGNKATEV